MTGEKIVDMKQQRVLNVALLVVVCLIYYAAQRGWIGDMNQRFAEFTLAFMLFVVLGRSVLTELGVRRKRTTSSHDTNTPNG